MGTYFNFLLRKTLGQDPFKKPAPIPKKKLVKYDKDEREIKAHIEKKVVLKTQKKKNMDEPSGIFGLIVPLVMGIIGLFVAINVSGAVMGSLNIDALGGSGNIIAPMVNFIPLIIVGVLMLRVISVMLRLSEI